MVSGRTLVFDSPYSGRVPNSAAEVRLHCLPFPGAGASAYLPWAEFLPSWVELCAVQLPGREDRFLEELLTRFPDVVEAVTAALAPAVAGPYALFGHSGGALLAYEVARALAVRGLPQPVHLFVSGENAPGYPPVEAPAHTLPDAAFLEAVRTRGGLDEELLANEEMLELILPIMRADFTWYETYRPAQGTQLNCPITAYAGRADELVDSAGMRRWGEFTTGPFEVCTVDGDHFTAWRNPERIAGNLAARLAP
jgi:medium-chain acyl-[acyl-carrier-protein] hydrolase